MPNMDYPGPCMACAADNECMPGELVMAAKPEEGSQGTRRFSGIPCPSRRTPPTWPMIWAASCSFFERPPRQSRKALFFGAEAF